MEKEWSTAREAASAMNVSMDTIRMQRKRNQLPAGSWFRMGGAYRYNVEKIIRAKLNKR